MMTSRANPDTVIPAPRVLAALQRTCSRPAVYRLLQCIAAPTTSRFRDLLRRHVHPRPEQRLLDLACGIGNYRGDLGGQYYGADINPDYIATARRTHSGTFDVMNCTALTYPDRFFDHVVSIAATHHLDDRELQAMVQGALRVCRDGGMVHVVDAILPETGHTAFKRLWFGLDAGRFPRLRDQLRSALAVHGVIAAEELLPGPLHDCAYFGVRAR
jgi:ubiquinone/menaquinone biosynthesis C-methylase UbiE